MLPDFALLYCHRQTDMGSMMGNDEGALGLRCKGKSLHQKGPTIIRPCV